MIMFDLFRGEQVMIEMQNFYSHLIVKEKVEQAVHPTPAVGKA